MPDIPVNNGFGHGNMNVVSLPLGDCFVLMQYMEVYTKTVSVFSNWTVTNS